MGKTAAAEKAKPKTETKKVVRLDFENIEVKRMIVAAKKSGLLHVCLLYTSPSPRDLSTSRMPSSA